MAELGALSASWLSNPNSRSGRRQLIAELPELGIGRGRPAKVAITACMRKLLVILNPILRDHRPWQPA